MGFRSPQIDRHIETELIELIPSALHISIAGFWISRLAEAYRPLQG